MAFIVGACGGWIFMQLGMPLPWTLGSLTASAVVAIYGNRFPMPVPVRNLARPVVGVMAGSAFTPQVAETMLSWWPIFTVVAVYTVLISAVGYVFFRRVWGLDPVTSYFSAMTGGLGEMLMLGDMYGGNARTIVFIHVIRVIAVVFTVPIVIQIILGHQISAVPISRGGDVSLLEWAALTAIGAGGFAIGRLTNFPGGEMTASMLLSATLHATGVVSAAPGGGVVILAQILIGAVAGSRFAGLDRVAFRSLIGPALSWAVVLLVTCISVAALAHRWVGLDLVTMLLGLGPAGTAEMIIITVAIGGEIALVSACQVLRILLVFGGAPMLFRAITGQRAAPK